MKTMAPFILMLLTLGLLLTLPAVQPAAADAPDDAALSQQPVLSDAEMAALQARQTQATDLAEFRAGGPDTMEIVAWTALGFGVTAFILALIAL